MPSTLGVTASQVFSPLDLSPALWLDAADTSTIIESSGDVSQWNDKSGNGRHFSQANGVNQPTTGIRTLNGLNVIDFDGTNDVLGAGDVLDLRTGNITVVSVVKFDATSGSGRTVIGKYRATPLAGSWLILIESGNLFSIYSRANNTNVNASQAFSTTATAIGHELRLDRGAGTLDQKIDGAAAGSNTFTPNTATDHNNSSGLWMGALRNSTDNGFLSGYWFDGYVAEVIVTLRTLTAAESADVSSYLFAKWGVTF